MKELSRFRGCFLGLMLICCFIVSGCSPKQVQAQKQSIELAQRPPWNWESYPLVTQMRLGTLPCQFQPRSTINVISPLMGILRVYVTSPQTNLPAGFLWAEFEPEIFGAEEKSLEEARRKLEDQEKLQWEIEFPRKKMQLEQQIEEAQRQVQYLRLLSTNALMRERIFNLPNSTDPLRPESLARSEAQLHLMQQNMTYLEATNFAALGVDLAGQRTEWERRKLDFQRRRAQSQFQMPFSGKLTVSVPLTTAVTNYPVNVNQELAIARDISSIRMRVVMENVSWTGLASDKLKAIVRTGGQTLEATFSYHKIERVQNREEAAYYFEFPTSKAEQAARLIGANVSCELWMELPEPVRVVPKLAVILHQPDAFQTRNWGAALSSVFPGARLVVEGQTDLGVAVGAELKLSSR
jgi:hypothetical protein